MENDNHNNVSLMLASLGWVFLVAAVITFFLVGQPYFYRQGYQQGLYDQRIADQQTYNESVGIPAIEDPATPLSVVITNIEGNILTVNLDDRTPNPFDLDTDRSWKLVIEEDTQLIKRVPLLREEVEELLQEAVDSGGTIAFVDPYEDYPMILEELKAGDGVVVYARNGEDKLKDEFSPERVVLLVTPNSANL